MNRTRTLNTAGRLPRLGGTGMVLLALLGLTACGASRSPASATTEEPTQSSAIVHHEEQVERGGNLFITDGCSSCHQINGRSDTGPGLEALVSRRVRLRDGRRVLVDERFLGESLRDPAADELAGYAPGPMLRALARHHLDAAQIKALTAFIEQVGPEPEPQ